MTSVIGFMTSLLFCSSCPKCNGRIDCPWLNPHDEANCPQQCLSSWYGSIPCDCNKPGNMTCEGENRVCIREHCKFLVLFYFCKRHSD